MAADHNLRCLKRHYLCPNLAHYVKTTPAGSSLSDLYEEVSEGAIELWKQYDRQDDRLRWEQERARMHDLAEPRDELRAWKHTINPAIQERETRDPVAREVRDAATPDWERVGLAFSIVTRRRVAVVKVNKLAGLILLHVDIEAPLFRVGKVMRHKVMRYQHELPTKIERVIDEQCAKAVMAWKAAKGLD
jgi:hypothetical protein